MTTTRLRQRLFFILFGLISVFLLLEAGLRLGARIYYSYRIKNKVSQLDNPNTIRILCLGDSFTFGEGAPKGYSYPEQLQSILNNNSSKRFMVYNGGVPGNNSSQLFKNLENNIQRYKPDITIVMTGSNNNNNLRQSNYFLFVDKSVRIYLYRLDAFLSHLRSYKLLKTGVINFYSKIRPKTRLKTECLAGDNEIFKTSSDKVKKYRKRKVPQELIEKAEKHLELGRVYEGQAKINLATAEVKKAIELIPHDDRPYYMLGYIYLNRSLYLKNKYELAIQELKKSIEINAFNIPARIELFDAYYRVGKTNLALEQLNIIHNLNPNEEWVWRLLTYGMPDFKDMEIFEKMLKYDLQNIIRLILSKRIKLILQIYPCDWPNETIREMAEINKIPFVDNQTVFKELESLIGYKRENYFLEDGHFNANGYRVIAQNVYRVLKSEMKELVE